MRVLAMTAIVLLPTIAIAQQIPQPPPYTPPSERMQSAPSTYSGGRMGTATPAPLNPDNCGTPDEPKSCPPMPRRAFPDYPANRQS